MKIPQKLWHHRTNRTDKFKQLAGSYIGFELDVSINSQGRFFEVYHHPEKPSGIDFRQYLEMKESAGKYFWLDCKNLNPENADLTIEMLNELDSIYCIKNRIIFESTSQRTLQRIREAGYHSIFYLALPELKNSCSDTAYLQRISENWDEGLVGVSAEAQYIPLLNRYLPAVKKLTWCNNPLKNLLLNEKNKMLADSSVLIVLEQQ